jgi:hypothetical protein
MLLGENHGLHSGNFKSLAAAHVFAGHQVVFSEHVGTRLGEAGAIPFIGPPAGKLALLGAHHPRHLVLSGLVAMWTVQGCWFLFRALVEKIAFFHESVVRLLVAGLWPDHFPSQPNRERRLLHVRLSASYGNMNLMARKKKAKRFRAVQAVKELARERMGTPPAAKVVPHKNRQMEKHKATLGKLLEETE